MTVVLLPNWGRIKNYYEAAPVEIWSVRDEWVHDPYEWEFRAGIRLTPIELSMWASLRMENLILYPQFPVGRYFVDFANPAARVAIECDGSAYHADSERDQRRQRDIEAAGWTVYRFTGRDCNDDTWSTWDDAKEREVVHVPPVRLRLRAIGQEHRINRDFRTPASCATAARGWFLSLGAAATDA